MSSLDVYNNLLDVSNDTAGAAAEIGKRDVQKIEIHPHAIHLQNRLPVPDTAVDMTALLYVPPTYNIPM